MTMCKDWFKKKYPIQPITGYVEHRFLTFGRNLYGGGNDLRGCVNDSNNMIGAFGKVIPGLTVHRYLDYDVTESNYLTALEQSIALLLPGSTVVMIMDSCYSGTATRNFMGNPKYIKKRFIGPEIKEPSGPVRKVARAELMKWIAISAASEHQTAADVQIGGQYVGAFSYYAYKTLKPGMTWKEWFNTIKFYLPSADLDQIPTIEGPEFLQERIIGQGPTLIIHNSSHGSWQVDKSGDEADGRDEGLYFDKFVSDDKINACLQKIVL